MGLAGRAEVLFDADVQLAVRAAATGDLEPAAAAGGQQRRLRQFRPAEHAVVERPESIFAARRAGDLDMVNHVSPTLLES
jgi:hypothetical protein